VTKKPASPYLSMVRFKKRGSWVSAQTSEEFSREYGGWRFRRLLPGIRNSNQRCPNRRPQLYPLLRIDSIGLRWWGASMRRTPSVRDWHEARLVGPMR
jgi:hypothetical protein